LEILGNVKDVVNTCRPTLPAVQPSSQTGGCIMKTSDEFKSQLENIMPAKELLYEPTPAFGRYKPFLEHAIAHPAKANTKLLEFLIKTFTKEGDVVLDPMAGTGSTGVVAALHGRNAIQIELERKFYEWMEKARENVEKHPTLNAKGWIQNICGDARRLSQLLNQAGFEPTAIVTSPPHGNTYLGGGGPQRRLERLIKAGHNPKDFLGGKARNAVLKHYSEVDTIITSPPYADVEKRDRSRESWFNEKKEREKAGGSVIIEKGYQGSPENIGNLPYIDTIITSPPYADTNDRKNRKMDSTRGIKNRALDLPENKQNIGNLPLGNIERLMRNGKPTYLSEMLKVYSEMFKVLKHGGIAIIIVKPFIRNRKVVDLPYHTWLLMEKVGFKLEKLYKLRLQAHSFWRILYYSKFKNVPKIAHEYIIIASKPALFM